MAAILVGLSTAAPGSAAGQIYEGWVLLTSSAAYDYLVPDALPTTLSSDAPDERILRVTMSRMLVRRVDRERQGLIVERQRIGARTTGYDEYASMTELIDVECTAGRFSVRERTDFDRNGTILDRQSFDRTWTEAERDTPMATVIRHVCGPRSWSPDVAPSPLSPSTARGSPAFRSIRWR
jgi:hypothetical protein